MYAALRAKPGHPRRDPAGGQEGTGAAPRAGESPGRNTPARRLCRPDGPAALPDVQNHREGGKTPVRGSGSESRDIQTAGAALGKPRDGSGVSPRSALFQHGDDGGTGQARRNGAGSRAGCDRVRAGNGRRPRADASAPRRLHRQGPVHRGDGREVQGVQALPLSRLFHMGGDDWREQSGRGPDYAAKWPVSSTETGW